MEGREREGMVDEEVGESRKGIKNPKNDPHQMAP